ncbi:hypothetical protein [Plantactinospora sonchi]|uniref:Uncharacterized protein n=1 Tax=Plantactinospora sonchi TaxID=1544735 RepID=A0ABU7RRA5_9ACTN
MCRWRHILGALMMTTTVLAGAPAGGQAGGRQHRVAIRNGRR